VLALALGGCTVAELQRRMLPGEFHAWVEFYRMWPFDDRHRFHRPAALIAGAMVGDVGKRLDWLQPTPMIAANDPEDSLEVDAPAAETAPGRTAADISTLRALGLWKNGQLVKPKN
jgi:hypothetical protein